MQYSFFFRMKKDLCTNKYLNADSGIKAFPFKYLSVLPLSYLTCSNKNLYTLLPRDRTGSFH